MSRRRKAEPERSYLDPDLASVIADDLPDGAYWAMMEELTGMEPADLVEPMTKRRPHDSRPKPELCPRCQRRFRTKRALADHTRDFHEKKGLKP
jgi:hypothetical protein